MKECGPCPVFASFTLAFALQLRKKHGKTCQGKKNLSQAKKNLSNEYSIYITKTPTHYQTPPHTHTHTHTHIHTHTHTHITKPYKTTTVQITQTQCKIYPKLSKGLNCRYRWLRGLKHRSATPRVLGLPVRIPKGA